MTTQVGYKLTYELGEEIEKKTGVFKGKYQKGIDVAVKKVKKDQIKMEDEVLQRIHIHPNIIHYYTTEEDDVYYYIVMGLCLCNLKNFVKRDDKFPSNIDIGIRNILIQATKGILHLHKNKIVLRSIKPQNILISDSGNGYLVKISNFAFSKIAKGDHSDYSMSGSTFDEPDWTAPELIDKTNLLERYTNKVDIFPLGCVICYALNGGQHPFGSNMFVRNGNILLEKKIPDYGILGNNEINENDAIALIDTMLQRDPEKRPTAQEVLDHAFFSSSQHQNSSDFQHPLSGIASESIIGVGSNNTVVYRCFVDNAIRACKRIDKSQNDTYQNEINIMIKLDDTANVVRYFSSKEENGHCYITMELGDSTLEACIAQHEFRQSSYLKQIVMGLEYLNFRAGIVHRDIKPSNILVMKRPGVIDGDHEKYILKLSDFGISKKLDIAGRDYTTEGRGSNGWRAPELALQHSTNGNGNVEYTSAVDIFAAGCVIFFTSTSGKHPYTLVENEEPTNKLNYKSIQANIDSNKEPNLGLIVNQPALHDLVHSMINRSPLERPTSRQLLSNHPFFWSSSETLDFVLKFSEQCKPDGKILDEDTKKRIINKLQGNKSKIWENGSWREKLPQTVKNELDYKNWRSYNGDLVYDLLRAIRNKYAHYESLTPDEKKEFGPTKEEFWKFWSTKFPNLIFYAWDASRLIPDPA